VPALRIPKGKGDGAIAPSLVSTGAAIDNGAGEDGTGARDVEVVAPSAPTLRCDMPTSTHVGEPWRAALHRSMRTCRERWPERLLRRAGEVGVSGLRLGERSSMR